MATLRNPSICLACQRKTETRYGTLPRCQAFIGGIPDEIWKGGYDHRNEYPGDNQIRFLLRPGLEKIVEQYDAWKEENANIQD